MPRLIPERATSFAMGMNDTAAPTDYRQQEVRLMENCRPSFAGTAVERRDGSRKLHATALNGGAFCWGAIEYYTAGGTQQIIAFFGDKVYKSEDRGATWTDITGALNITENWWSFAIMRVGNTEFLFAANGATNILQWDGTTLSVLTASAGSVPAGVKFLAVANDRLYVAGHNGNEVHASDVGDPTNWDTTQGSFTVRVQTHDGDTEIRALYQFGAALLVWKRRSTNYIEGFGVRTIEVESGPRGASRSVGCAGHRTVAAVGASGVMWLSERGFEYFDGGRIQLVSRRQQQFVDTINWRAISDDPMRPVALYYERKHEYWCVVPRTGAFNTAVYVFRLPQSGAPAAAYIFRRADPGTASGDYFDTDANGYVFIDTAGGGFSTSVDASGYQTIDADQSGDPVEIDSSGYVDIVKSDTLGGALFVADTDDDLGVPHEGTANGFVMRLDDGDTDFAEPDATGGNPITMRLEGRPFLYGDPVQRKRARHMRVTFVTPGTATVTMAVEADGTETFNRSVSLNATPGEPVAVRERVNGRGRTIVPIIETTEDIQVQALEIESYFMRRN